MHTISKIELKPETHEELLPGFFADFPYITSYVELDKYPERFVPWHWHNTVELFYMESGTLEYCTPGGIQVFPAGTGGLVNSNVLHMTRVKSEAEKSIQLIHLFDPSFIAGKKGSRIDTKYVMPLTTATQIELIALYPDNPKQKELLEKIREAFTLDETKVGYEIQIREKLSDIWLGLFDIVKEKIAEKNVYHKSNDQIKQMMLFIQEHFSEKISITELANVAYLSERACYRVFHECLHMTPVEYIRSYRIQMACQMLLKGDANLAEISQDCGLGSSSYFGKIFKETIGCTPFEYRQKWQNSDI